MKFNGVVMKLQNLVRLNVFIGIFLSGLIGNAHATVFHWDGNNPGDELLTAGNWTPAGPPSSGDTGKFDLTSASLTPTQSNANLVFSIDSFQFTDSTAFQTRVTNNAIFHFTKEGVLNTGGANQVFLIDNLGTLQFINALGNASGGGSGMSIFMLSAKGGLSFFQGATAGASTIVNDDSFVFFDSGSKAGSSTITATNKGQLNFASSSDAESAMLFAYNDGRIGFINSTANTSQIYCVTGSSLTFVAGDAGSSSIAIDASSAEFSINSHASAATISCTNLAQIIFDQSTADTAIINTNNSTLAFVAGSNADNAIINASDNSFVFVESNSFTQNTTINLADSTLTYDLGGNALGATISAIDSEINFEENAQGGGALFQLFDSDINFNLTSRAQGASALLQDSNATFSDTSEATVAHFVLGSSTLLFQDASKASSAILDIGSESTLIFADTSTANTAVISLEGNSHTSFIENSKSASSTIDMDQTSTLSFQQTSNDTFSGTVTGPGKIVKNSASTLNFTGDGDLFTGLTQVVKGTFALNSNLGGTLTVNGTGILHGTGNALGDVFVNKGATISPGNSIGTLHINGNYTQNAGSTYLVELKDNLESDLIDIDGIATINGGTVDAISTDGTLTPFLFYNILHADGGVTGTYTPGTFLSNPLFAIHLVYDPNDIFLLLATNFAIFGETRNQKNVALQFDSIINPSPEELFVINNLLTLDPPQLRNALDQMGGEQYTSLIQINHQATQRFLRRIYDPLRDILAFRTCYDPCAFNLDTWFAAEAGHSTLTHDRNAHGYQVNDFNFTLGAQYRLNEQWTFGAAVAYNQDWIHYSLGGHGHLYNTQGALYAAYAKSNYYIFSDVVFGETYCSLRRHIDFADLDETATGKPRIWQTTSYTEIGKNFNVSCFSLQPFIGLEAGFYHRSGFHERHAAALSLHVKTRNIWIVTSRLGLHAQTALNCGIEIGTDIAWQHNYNFDRDRITTRFAPFGERFEIIGVGIDNDSIDASLEVSADVNDCLNVYAEVSTQAWNRYANYSVTGGLQYNW